MDNRIDAMPSTVATCQQKVSASIGNLADIRNFTYTNPKTE